MGVWSHSIWRANPLYFVTNNFHAMSKRKADSSAENNGSTSKKDKIVEDKEENADNDNGETEIITESFDSDAKTKDGKLFNLKIASWNVSGLRAMVKKNNDYLKNENPDIIGLHETKCPKAKLPPDFVPEGYHAYWVEGEKDGYAGVGLLSKVEPIEVKYGLGIKKHDNEGRVITAEYDKFYFVTTYVPNAGKKLVRLDYRINEWDNDFREYLQELDKKKPVIVGGDLNVAHLEIDLKNPKTNKKNAGFTDEERNSFSELLKSGFVDSFRELYPDKEGCYTFWTYMMNARAKNVGWRLDYFLLSNRILTGLCDNVMRTNVMGSDHCPIVLLMNI